MPPDVVLLLEAKNYIVNQTCFSETRGDCDQYGFFTDFINRLKRFVINNRNIIELRERRAFDCLPHDFGKSRRASLAFTISQQFTERFGENDQELALGLRLMEPTVGAPTTAAKPAPLKLKAK